MKRVILSSDGEALLYGVPDEVAEHLREYCAEFACEWLWKSPDAAQYRRVLNEDGLVGVSYGAQDFIAYLNKWRFPQQPSRLIKGLGCYDYEIGEEYAEIPRFSF